MDDQTKPPTMLTLLFGQAAETARLGASRRLLRWCAAFDEWLAELRNRYTPATARIYVHAWRRLLRQHVKPPWELEAADIEAHAGWLQAQGYAASTIANAIGIVANFYRWCGQRQVDPECEPGFNPAAQVRRPEVHRYAGAQLLTRGELQALLGLLQKDSSPLGLRDYAFILARMQLGVPLRLLQRLQWGQIEQNEAGAWVRWRPDAQRARLPGEVWAALQAYLEASGRLSGMGAESFLFAPLVFPLNEGQPDKPEAWKQDRCISTRALLQNLKLYGRLAGIPAHKLTLQALHRTALRLKLEQGASLEEMQAFLDTREAASYTRFRLGKLPQLLDEQVSPALQAGSAALLPVRTGVPFEPWQGMTHGLYAKSQPPQAIESVLKEDIQGIDEQILGLRVLAREILERQGRATRTPEAVQLGNAYTLLASRLAEMIKAEAELAKDSEDSQWAKDMLQLAANMRVASGEAGEAGEASLESEPELELASRRLREEIAGLRYVLRNTFRLALEASELQEAIRLAELYSSGCSRLVRLLKMEKSHYGHLAEELGEQLRASIIEAMRGWEVTREWVAEHFPSS